MVGAGEGDENGLRIGRYVTDSVEAAPPPDASAVLPTVSTSTNAPTQLLPVVKIEPTIVDVPTIRARARRPATPLPALGSDAPAPTRAESKRAESMRAESKRRRPAAASPSPSPSPPVTPSASLPVVTPVVVVDEGGDASALEADTGELPIIVEQPVIGERPVIVEQPVIGERSAIVERPAIGDAEAVEDPPARHRVPEAGETAVPDATVVTEPLTQEPAVVRPAADPADDWDPIADADDSRPGPAAIEADDWDAEPETTGDVDTYQGRRRAAVRSRRLWLVLAAVVVALAAAVGIPLALTSSPATEDPTAAALPLVEVTDTGAAPPTGELISAASSVGPDASKPPTSKPPSTVPPTVKPTTVPPVGFSPITLQADGSSASRANVVLTTVAGATGQVIDRLGEWGGPDGVVTFTFTMRSAGSYVMTMHYVFVWESDDPSRRVWITVNGTTLSPEQTFPRVTTCCATRPVRLTLRSGINTIRLTHGDFRSPALEKIVISKP